jgi:zinc transporter ZupT
VHVAGWVAALVTLVGFGLALGLNPALYGATADMLARGSHVAARMIFLLAGLVVGATVLYVLLQSFDPASFVSIVERDAGAAVLRRGVDFVAGGVFLAAAIGVAWWKLRVPERPAPKPRPDKSASRSWSYFPLGLSCSIIGFTTLPIMYMTGRVTAEVSSEWLPRLLAYGVFLVALVAPFVLLAGAWSLFPAAGERVTRIYTRLIHLDYRWMWAGVLALAAVVCVGFGWFAGH